ncbi:MAG: cytochrome c oxidase subunit II [Acidimicrobiales bacterium]|nr:cytochrome c oxidase subunit II [Acidimicrobiales bacterium]
MTRPRRSRLAIFGGLAALSAFVLSGCAMSLDGDTPQTTLDPQGPKAQTIHNLVVPVFAIAGVVFVLVMAGSLYVALRFRAKDDADFDEFPEQLHGNFKLEIGWTILPAVVLLVVAVFTVATIFDLAKKPDAQALKVEVIGQQWWWEYRYSYDFDNDGQVDQIITANDLVIPTGREIALRIKSNDVIHSWWAPSLNGKRDAVPGRVHPLTINAPDVGEYIGQCTEFCGLSHAEMRIKVVALSPDDFQAWAEKQIQPFEAPTEEAAAAGFEQFASQCTTCHRITGMTDPSDDSKLYEYDSVINQVAGNAPNLTKFATRTTFAGAKFDLRLPTEECKALGEDWASTDEGIEKCLNREDLEAWLRNPPAEKAMHAGDSPTPESRGMPNFNLTEDQIDDLVAFLITLQ